MIGSDRERSREERVGAGGDDEVGGGDADGGDDGDDGDDGDIL
ncbi:hypothetical protein [Streptomyces noursei]|nr:hypothetical protein [Streptomyces noursei]